jgi:Domain of unknown function (DUF5666)
MRRLINRCSVAALAALLVVLNACGGSDSHDKVVPPPPESTVGLVSVGTITGFGSVYVNGIRYRTTDAQVVMNDVAAAESGLKVGHYVEVKGHSHNSGDHDADVIRYHNVLEGPITSIDTMSGTFVAMGQMVQVTAETSFGDGIEPASIEGLAVKDVVEVSGMVTTLGVIDATRIDIKPDSGPYDVTGYVSKLALATHRFNVNALVVDYSSANMDDFPTGQPTDGDLVLVKGSTFNADGSFAATRVELRSDDWLKAAAGDVLEVEGAITDFVSATKFNVAGRAVTTTPTTLYEHGTVATLANDVLVEVEGTADTAGVLVALKVKFKQVSEIRIVAQIQEKNSPFLKLLGLQVATNEVTHYEDMSALALRNLGLTDLAVNDWVDVRGYEEPAGSNRVTATRIVRVDAQEAVRLRGPFLDPAKPSFHILSVPVATGDTTRFVLEGGVRLTQSEFFTQAVDQFVEAWGTWTGTAITADRVEIKVDED